MAFGYDEAVIPGYQQRMMGPGMTGPMPPVGATGPAGAIPATGAMNAPMGGTPFTPGMGAVGPGGMTPQEAFNPLQNEREAMVRAILAKGLNPASPTYGISKLLQRADDIVRGLAGRLAMGGNADVLTGGGFQDALNALVASGGPMISGRSEGRVALDALRSLAERGREGTGSEGENFLAALFGGEGGINTAAGFADALLYGGAAPNVRGALNRGLRVAPSLWSLMAESPAGFEQQQRQTALDILLSGVLGGMGQRPAFGGGNGLQYTGGAANPLAQQLGVR